MVESLIVKLCLFFDFENKNLQRTNLLITGGKYHFLYHNETIRIRIVYTDVVNATGIEKPVKNRY